MFVYGPPSSRPAALDHVPADLPGLPRRPVLHPGEFGRGIRPFDLHDRRITLDLPDGDDDLPGRALVGVGPEGCRGRAVIQYHRADDTDALRPVVWCIGRLVVGAPRRTQRAYFHGSLSYHCRGASGRRRGNPPESRAFTRSPGDPSHLGIKASTTLHVTRTLSPGTVLGPPVGRHPTVTGTARRPVIFQGSTYRHFSTGVDRP